MIGRSVRPRPNLRAGLRRLGGAVVAVATVLGSGCVDAPAGPVPTALRIVPVLRQEIGRLILEVDELRLRVFDTDGTTLLADVSVPVTPADVEIEVEAEVDATPGRALTVDVALRRNGDDVYVGGPTEVVPSDVPTPIEVEYVGEGACRTTVGDAAIGPIGGAPGLSSGRLELGDCYLPMESSFADRWRLELPRDAGVTLQATPEGTSPDLRLALETPDGVTVADGATDGFDLFLGAGSYIVIVTSAEPLATPSYRLAVSEFDRCDAEAGLLAPGVSVVQTLTETDCPLASGRTADLWGLDVDDETPYRIDLESDAFDGYLLLTGAEVLDPFLAQALAEDDDRGLGTDALLAGVLAPGRYRVWATSSSPGETGSYDLSMSPLNPGAPALVVRAVTALGVGGPGGVCSSAQAFRFDFAFEDGDGDLTPPGGVTIRLTRIPSGVEETKGVTWDAFEGINPFAGFAEIITCETFGIGTTSKQVEFFLTDAAGRSSIIFSTTLAPPSASAVDDRGSGAPPPVARPGGEGALGGHAGH